MSIPNSISYRNVRPAGIPSRIKKVSFTPQNTYNEIRPNDVVRFHIKAPTFWDPYNCYVKLKVDFSEMESGYVQQLDGSAQSFISEVVISAGSTEIERIQEYDILAGMLMDVSYDNHGRLAKQHEGLSSEILESNNFDTITKKDNALIFGRSGVDGEIITSVATHGFKPTLRPIGKQYINRKLSEMPKVFFNSETYGMADVMYENETFGNLANPLNIISHAAAGQYYPQTLTGEYKDAEGKTQTVTIPNPRYKSEGAKYIDEYIQRADKAYVNGRKKGHPGVFEPIYMHPSSNEQLAEDFYHSDATEQEFKPVGNTNIFTKEYSSGCFEDTFSKDDWEYLVHEGKVSTPIKHPRTCAEYCFPLLSGVLGILMPRENYKLFPAFAVENLTIEFRVNPYAVFTSGYFTPPNSGVNASDHGIFKNLTTQPKRAFKIKEFELVVDLIQFDESVTDLMRQQLQGDGIILSTHSWSLGPLYNIKDTASCLGTWQMNMGFESLKSIYLIYLSNDYMTYSFCRKNYRMSRNIISLQIKIGLEYFPDKALEGHAGNPYLVDKEGENNWIFLYELWKNFGHLNDVFQHNIINRHNFCINERPYDVTSTKPYINHLNPIVEQNIDTAMGYPLIHENRMVGRSIFVLNLAYNADNTMLNGVNTIQNRPFDVIVKVDPSGSAVNASKDRPCTMMTFFHYDFLVQITINFIFDNAFRYCI